MLEMEASFGVRKKIRRKIFVHKTAIHEFQFAECVLAIGSMLQWVNEDNLVGVLISPTHSTCVFNSRIAKDKTIGS